MSRPARAGTAVFVAGIVLLAVNLRPTITSLPPIFPELESDLGLSSSAVTALATLPVLCFGVFAAAAAPLARHHGEEAVLEAALAVLAVALLLRGAAAPALLFPATALAAGAIALMNVLLSSLIKRRAPRHTGPLLSLYLTALYVGAIVASGVAVPLYRASHGSHLVALGLWAVPAAVAAAAWTPQLRHHTVMEDTPRGRREGTGAGRGGAGARRGGVMRHALAWQVAAFMGLQSLTYYATLSWLPVLLRDRGVSADAAGADVALTSVGGLVTALLVPVAAHRMPGQRALVGPAIAACALGIGGAMWLPLSAQAVWMLVLGLGQGATFALALYFTMVRSATPDVAASLSGLAQTAGYLLAAAGPLTVGLLHAATGAWTLPVLLLLAVTATQAAVGLFAARPLAIAAPP